jgi:hypothetical protein
MDGVDLGRSRRRQTRAANARGKQKPMVRRRDAAQATLDKIRAKPMKLGSRDCLRKDAHHLRLLGYSVKLPPAGSYKTVRSALRKLRELGHADLPAAIDSIGLKRIVPAAAIVGDIVQVPWSENADDPLCALMILLGNGRAVGYHEDRPGADVLQPLAGQIVSAWRVVPQ